MTAREQAAVVDVAGLRAAVEESLAYTGRYKFALDYHAATVLALLDHLERAEAAVARVEALADDWEREGDDLIRNCHSGRDVNEGEQLKSCARELRAALTAPTP